MSIIYDEKSVFTGRPGSLQKLDPNRKWAQHFANGLVLIAIQQSPRDLRERIQATRELAICERKMQYWMRHQAFSMEQAVRDANAARALWGLPTSGTLRIGQK